MSTDRFRTTTALALATGLVVGLTAACSGGADQQAGGPVTITIDGQPPQTQPFDRKIFDADVAAFEKAHPDIKVTAHEGFMDPKTFSAKLAGGQLEDVFYVYFTDPANLIARHQAADITDYVKDVPHVNDIQPALLDVFKDAQGHVIQGPIGEYDPNSWNPDTQSFGAGVPGSPASISSTEIYRLEAFDQGHNPTPATYLGAGLAQYKDGSSSTFGSRNVWSSGAGNQGLTGLRNWLRPGDADLDGLVTAADYVIWRKNQGGSGDWRQGDFNLKRKKR